MEDLSPTEASRSTNMTTLHQEVIVNAILDTKQYEVSAHPKMHPFNPNLQKPLKISINQYKTSKLGTVEVNISHSPIYSILKHPIPSLHS
jgi:hypothetical protein